MFLKMTTMATFLTLLSGHAYAFETAAQYPLPRETRSTEEILREQCPFDIDSMERNILRSEAEVAVMRRQLKQAATNLQEGELLDMLGKDNLQSLILDLQKRVMKLDAYLASYRAEYKSIAPRCE